MMHTPRTSTDAAGTALSKPTGVFPILPSLCVFWPTCLAAREMPARQREGLPRTGSFTFLHLQIPASVETSAHPLAQEFLLLDTSGGLDAGSQAGDDAGDLSAEHRYPKTQPPHSYILSCASNHALKARGITNCSPVSERS